jgi:hypothetical protein
MTGRSPIATAGWLLASGITLVLLCVALILHDLSGANRPHELKLVPLVSTLSLLNLFLCTRTQIQLFAIWHARQTRPPRSSQYLLIPLGLAYGCASVFLVPRA